MDDKERAEFKEFIFQAVQAGKQETSGLVDMILHKMEPVIEKSIEKFVNGHMREMKAHLSRQDETLKEIPIISLEQTRVANELAEVKKVTDPYIKSRMTVLNLGRFVIWVGKPIIWLGTISGATAAIIWLIVWFMDKIKNVQ